MIIKLLTTLTNKLSEINKNLSVKLVISENSEGDPMYKLDFYNYEIQGMSYKFLINIDGETNEEKESRYNKVLDYLIKYNSEYNYQNRENIIKEFNKENIKAAVYLDYNMNGWEGEEYYHHDSYSMKVIIGNKVYTSHALFPNIQSEYYTILNDYVNRKKIDEFTNKVWELGFNHTENSPNCTSYLHNRKYLYFYTNGKIVLEDHSAKEYKDWTYNEFQTFDQLKEYLDSINL